MQFGQIFASIFDFKRQFAGKHCIHVHASEFFYFIFTINFNEIQFEFYIYIDQMSTSGP